jgi:hypothetical protein
LIAAIWAGNIMGTDGESLTTELDSHANMVVVGKHATIIARTGRHAEVQAFSNECNTLQKVPIVDAAIAYDDKYTGKTFILVMKNVLYVETMERNLIPPFILREAGLIVNDVPRIHCGEELNDESHCIIDRSTGMKIRMFLRGIFSGFDSRELSQTEIDNCDDYELVMLTPDASQWDPYDEVYADNEQRYLAWDGSVQEPLEHPKRRKLITEEDEQAEMFTFQVSGEQWEQALDEAVASVDLNFSPYDAMDPNLFNVDQDDPIRAQIADLTGLLDPEYLREALNASLDRSRAAMAAGCAGMPEPMLADDDGLWISFEAAAAHAEISKDVTKEMLAKVWRISEDEARRTLEVTTQLNRQGADTSLSRRAGTNDRMLRYKRIQSMFFMDTFFVTKRAKSVRGFTMMQIFVSDKGFVKVYGMTSQTDIPKAMKLFAKEVGAPNTFVCDPHPNQKSKEVRATLCWFVEGGNPEGYA